MMTLGIGGSGDNDMVCPGADLPDDEGTVTTRTPGGNDQRESIQHNVLRINHTRRVIAARLLHVHRTNSAPGFDWEVRMSNTEAPN